MKTVLAVIVAAALIAGALYIRGDVLDGENLIGGGTADGQVADGEEAPQPDEDVRVACDAVLGDACPAGAQRLDLTGLLAAFEGQQRSVDVLIAPLAVVELIEGSQTSQATFSSDRATIASTPLIAVVQESRAEVVEDACGAEVTWSCLGDVIQDGRTTTAFANPSSHTEGMAVIAALAGGFFGTTNYNANAFGDGAFLSWLDGLQAGSSSQQDPVSTLIQFSGARNDSAISIEATGVQVAQRGAERTATEIYWPTPVASLSVVAVGIGGTDPSAAQDVIDSATQALTDAGWRGADGEPLDGGPPLEEDDGLPNGGVLFSLRREWN